MEFGLTLKIARWSSWSRQISISQQMLRKQEVKGVDGIQSEIASELCNLFTA